MTGVKLTSEQLEAVKDDVKFRTTVILELQGLKEKNNSLHCDEHIKKMDGISKLCWTMQGQLVVIWGIVILMFKKVFF